MDEDQSGTIDRIEWVTYLTAPFRNPNQHGNNTYYDLETRELFARIDANNDYCIDMEELCTLITEDMG